MQTGKLIRLGQFTSQQNRAFLVAADTTIPRGLHPAMMDPIAALGRIAHLPCDGILLHSGLAKLAAPVLAGQKPFLVKLTTTSAYAHDKSNRILVDSIEHALTLGASAVAINVFVGSDYEPVLLEHLGESASICDRLGLPLVAMINPMPEFQFDPDRLAYVCRLGAELGADIVKTDYPGSPEAFARVTGNCPVPVLVEESPFPETDEGTLQMTRDAITAGGAGVMFASRVWASPAPENLAQQIRQIVHG